MIVNQLQSNSRDSMASITQVLDDLRSSFCVISTADGKDSFVPGSPEAVMERFPGRALRAWIPATVPDDLGARSFMRIHGCKYPYVIGEMAGGISSEAIVTAAAGAGLLAFFGTGGVPLERIEQAILNIRAALRENQSFGFNLLHNPFDADAEFTIVEMFIRHGVTRVSASAFTHITPAIVYFRVKGLYRDAAGKICAPHKIFAKISRTELAKQFMEPPPESIVRQLLAQGKISEREAEFCVDIPLAEDVTIEGDSGGHSDRRSTISLLSSVCDLRDQICRQRAYDLEIRVGAAGGISTPASVAAAFIAGASYILTGSINQSCREANTSLAVKKMLSRLDIAGVAMAPSADMFEMGVKVQVVKTGTLFSMRAVKLYDLYKKYSAIEDIPESDRMQIEKQFFRMSIQDAWIETERYLQEHNPDLIEKARTNAKVKMALLFRRYLALSSRWAKDGVEDRAVDYQVWCGPAMGAFNQWVKGTFLEDPERRDVVTLAFNLLFGACRVIRTRLLEIQGIAVDPAQARVNPKSLEQLI